MKENSNNTKPKYSHFKILYGDDLAFHHLYSPREGIYRNACKIKDIDFEEIISNPIPNRNERKYFKARPLSPRLGCAWYGASRQSKWH